MACRKNSKELLKLQFYFVLEWDWISCAWDHFCHQFAFCPQVLVALACDLGLDSLPACMESHKWLWFRRYCMAARVAKSLESRTPLPTAFGEEVSHTPAFSQGSLRSLCCFFLSPVREDVID